MNYFDHPAISNSKLGEFKKSPMHYKFFQDNVKKESPAFLIGDAAHTILLEPEKINKKFFVLREEKRPEPDKDYRNAKNKEWKEDQIALNAGKSMLTVSDYDMLMFMKEKLFDNKFAAELILGSAYEEEYYFKDSVLGMDGKAKIDIRKKGLYKADYKSTTSADPYEFQRNSWKYGYYRQAAFYTDAEGPEEDFYFIAQEKTPPYAVSIHKCTPELLNHGREEKYRLMVQLKACIDNDYWPGYEMKNILSDNPYFDLNVPDWVIQNQ